MSEPFNLDAVIAERKPREPFRFIFDGEEYELAGDIDMRVAVSLSEPDQIAVALRQMLGIEQWKRIVASPKTFDVPAFAALMEAYAKHTGADVGELQASPVS